MSPRKDYEKICLGKSRKLAETCLSKAQALEKFKAVQEQSDWVTSGEQHFCRVGSLSTGSHYRTLRLLVPILAVNNKVTLLVADVGLDHLEP